MAVVCDGIGSLPDAEKASGFVTEQLINWFYHAGPKIFSGWCKRWTIPNTVGREIYRIRRCFEGVLGKLGCTLSLLLVVDRKYYLWHVGDSRIYRGRGGKFYQLTRDDSYRGMLTGCIGNFPWKGVVMRKGFLRRKDTFVLCTDGFYKKLSQSEQKAVFSGETIDGEPQAQKMLTEAARRVRNRGETDDISAVFVKII